MKKILIYGVVIILALSIVMSIDPTILGNDQANIAAINYLKSQFGETYYKESLIYRETIRISKSSAVGNPLPTKDPATLVSGTSGVNDSTKYSTDIPITIDQEPLDHFMVIFDHSIKIGDKYYKSSPVTVFLNPNYEVVRTAGVVNCVNDKTLCTFKITEEKAIDIAKRNDVTGDKISARIIFNFLFKKYVWSVAIYNEITAGEGVKELLYGKSIIIDSYNGDVLQELAFIDSESTPIGKENDQGTDQVVGIPAERNYNIFQIFWAWLISLFK